MPAICVPDDAPPVLSASSAWKDLTERAVVEYHDTLPGSEERLIERIGKAEVVLNIRSSVKFTGRVFTACPALRMLSVWGTGTDHVDLDAAAHRGVAVANTPGVSAAAVAEHTLALLLAAARRIPQMDAAVRRGEWPRGHSMDLRGRVCGVIGLGAIGREFARLASAIGMQIIAWTPHPRPFAGVELVELEDLYRTSDVISLHLRLSEQTRGFLSTKQFESMKPGVILVNTARGGIVDEGALREALASGRVRAAALDVFATEPLGAGHAWAEMPNVVLTPHCAGISPDVLEAGLRLAVENIWAFLEGRPQNLVA
jgi:D-3-phosphoglycerate dehydrogenase / 2-oxoglutarate reductase